MQGHSAGSSPTILQHGGSPPNSTSEEAGNWSPHWGHVTVPPLLLSACLGCLPHRACCHRLAKFFSSSKAPSLRSLPRPLQSNQHCPRPTQYTTEGSLRSYILPTGDAKLLPHTNLLTSHNHLIKSYYPHFTGQKTEISSTASQWQTPSYSHHSNAWPLNHYISHFPPNSELGLPSYAGLY